MPTPLRSGRTVTINGYEAFVPPPLPPVIEWSRSLLHSLSDANHLLGRLAGEGRALPNPHLLMRPFIRREAVLSSRIEGTQATLGELLAAEAGAAVSRSPDDLRKVANYVVALDYGIERLGTLPLSLRLVKELHALLMKGVRGDAAAPGEFRRIQNWIGGPGSTPKTANYVPPPPDELMGCLEQWEKFLHERPVPALAQAALMHYQFEAIHPFLDGNGRVGRLLITLFLIERRMLSTPLLYLSAFFEATRSDYYRLLNVVRREEAWGEWLEYVFNGIARMSEDALSRAERINRLLAQWRTDIVGARSKLPLQLVDLLAENPYWTVKKLAQRTGVAFSSAERAIGRLVSFGILTPVSDAQRGRVYCAQQVMAILDEPAKLMPGTDAPI